LPDVMNEGLLRWRDLSGAPGAGFNRDLLPAASFAITAVFEALPGVTLPFAFQNSVTATEITDIYGNSSARAVGIRLPDPRHLYLPLVTRN